MAVRTRMLCFVVLLLPFPAGAAQPVGGTPEIFQKLLDCRSILAAEARLACFDTQSASIGTAVDKKELVVADQAQLRQTRRSLFGMALPKLALFGGGGDEQQEAAEFSTLESTISSVRKRADRNWLFVLEDGARWMQTDKRSIPRDPKPGQTIRIRRAAMGSYLANVDNQIAVRVQREN